MSGWTKGPWEIQRGNTLRCHGGHEVIYSIGPIEVGFAGHVDDVYLEVEDADARLIAAAPDIYAALEKAHAFIADQYGDAESQALQGEFVSAEARPVWNAICEALAKAHGE